MTMNGKMNGMMNRMTVSTQITFYSSTDPNLEDNLLRKVVLVGVWRGNCGICTSGNLSSHHTDDSVDSQHLQLLPPASAVEVIESEPCFSVCVSVCLSVSTLTAEPFDLRP